MGYAPQNQQYGQRRTEKNEADDEFLPTQIMKKTQITPSSGLNRRTKLWLQDQVQAYVAILLFLEKNKPAPGNLARHHKKGRPKAKDSRTKYIRPLQGKKGRGKNMEAPNRRVANANPPEVIGSFRRGSQSAPNKAQPPLACLIVLVFTVAVCGMWVFYSNGMYQWLYLRCTVEYECQWDVERFVWFKL